MEPSSSKLNIYFQDPVWCIVEDKFSRQFVRGALTFEQAGYRQGQYGGTHYTRRDTLLKAQGLFLRGLFDYVADKAESQGIEVRTNWDPDHPEIHTPPYEEPNLPGITFKDFQLEAIHQALEKKRGIILAPPRSGKTVIAAGIFSAYNIAGYARCIFVCHSKDILQQTYEDFTEKFGFLNVTKAWGGEKDLSGDIVIASIKTLSTIKPEELDEFEVLVIDECHHADKLDSNYFKLLTHILVPIRIGLTATLPPKGVRSLTLEGLIGTVIYEMGVEEAQEEGLTAEAKIRVVKAPSYARIKNCKTYLDAYRIGITFNRSRNRLIQKMSMDYIEEGNTVLIVVTKIQHGMELKDIFDKFSPELNVPFLCGGVDADTRQEIATLKSNIKKLGTDPKRAPLVKINQEQLDELQAVVKRVSELSKTRDQYRHKLINGEIRCVIATNIWNEGVNIPPLNILINAGGGKSEIKTIQAASRSLTKVPGKDYGLIVDIFDPDAKWFIEHFGQRVCLYTERGWLG